MTETFAPARPPSYSSKKNSTYRVKKIPFGDGYKQRAKDGPNNKTVTWDLSWNSIPVAEVEAIETFLDACAGGTSFFYTVPRDIERKYVCENFTRALESGATDSLSATFEEDLGP